MEKAIERAGEVIAEALKESADGVPAAPRGHRGRGRDARALVRGAGGADRGRGRRRSGSAICLDSCHLLASGYDVRTAEALARRARRVRQGRRARPPRLAARQRLDDRRWAPTATATPTSATARSAPTGIAAFLSEPRFEGLPVIFEGPGRRRQGRRAADIENAIALRERGLKARARPGPPPAALQRARARRRAPRRRSPRRRRTWPSADRAARHAASDRTATCRPPARRHLDAAGRRSSLTRAVRTASAGRGRRTGSRAASAASSRAAPAQRAAARRRRGRRRARAATRRAGPRRRQPSAGRRRPAACSRSAAAGGQLHALRGAPCGPTGRAPSRRPLGDARGPARRAERTPTVRARSGRRLVDADASCTSEHGSRRRSAARRAAPRRASSRDRDAAARTRR